MAAFSRKHYVVLRDAIIKARINAYDINGGLISGQRTVDQVAHEIGCALAKDNSRFNLEQFLSDIRGYRSPR